MIVGREAPVGEEEAVAAFLAQPVDHRDDRVAHIIGDRAAAEGEAAEYRCGPVDRPAEDAPRHLGDAGETAVEFDEIEIRDRHAVEFERAIDARLHADAAVVAVAMEDARRLLGRGAHADIDEAVLGDAASARLGEARDEEARALVDRRVGDHQLRIGEGDGAIAVVDLEDVVR